MAVHFEKREQEVLDLLDAWPWELGGVVIGGYAVAAYGKPRYSNDLDVVIPGNSTMDVENWLIQNGFKLSQSAVPNPQNYDGKVFRFECNTVTIDLLCGAVRDREAQIDVPAEWISSRPKRIKLSTIVGATKAEVPIVRAEGFWALKLQAGRDQDITDLFSIFKVKVDAKEVKDLYESLWTPNLESKLHKTLAKLSEPKMFEDSMSRLEIKQTPGSRSDWKSFERIAESMVPL